MMGIDGDNIAVFDESLFKCVVVHSVRIKKVDYIYYEIASMQ